jgi:hypothetical protein
MPTLVLNTTAQTQDTRIVKHNPASNFSADASLFLEATSTTNQARVMVKFLDLLPPGGTVSVSAATLSFFNADAAGATRAVEVRKFLQPWGYATTSWNNRDTGTPWAVAGALGGAEVDATVIATGTAPTGANTGFSLTGAGLIAYCQSVMNGGVDHGLLVNLLDDASVQDGIGRRIRKSSFGTQAQRPTLTIEYTTGGPPPNWTVSNPTVNSDAGTATVVLTLDAPAPAGGVNGFFSTTHGCSDQYCGRWHDCQPYGAYTSLICTR